MCVYRHYRSLEMLWATKFELSITLITFAHLIKYNQYHEIVTESPMNRPNYNFISITQCYTHPTEIISTNFVKFLFLSLTLHCVSKKRHWWQIIMPNFVKIGQSIAEIIEIFLDFSRWRPSAILDLFGAYVDHSRRVLRGPYHCA